MPMISEFMQEKLDKSVPHLSQETEKSQAE